ncbi:Protein FANTASTIC FOUR 4, partial [Cucurbita argyrosperma subsp. sororia]
MHLWNPSNPKSLPLSLQFRLQKWQQWCVEALSPASILSSSKQLGLLWPPHLTSKLNAQPPPPFRSAFKSVFLDLDCVESVHECDESNRIVLTRNANYSVLLSSNGPKKSDSRGEEKSAVAIKDLDPDYVHPLVKRSRSTLSEKSLALCTENLGNETGADFVEDAIFSDLKVERSPTRKRVKSNDNQGNKKLFPPPLTTIAGVDSIRVRSYRETEG